MLPVSFETFPMFIALKVFFDLPGPFPADIYIAIYFSPYLCTYILFEDFHFYNHFFYWKLFNLLLYCFPLSLMTFTCTLDFDSLYFILYNISLTLNFTIYLVHSLINCLLRIYFSLSKGINVLFTVTVQTSFT